MMLEGNKAIAPTEKGVTVTGIHTWGVADGKTRELWFHRDDLGMMLQLGVTLAPGQTN